MFDQFTPTNTLRTPGSFHIGGRDFIMGFFFVDPDGDGPINPGYTPALVEYIGANTWTPVVEYSTMYKSNTENFGGVSKGVARIIMMFNEWLREEFGEDADLTDFEEWIRDASELMAKYQLISGQLVLM